MNLVQISLSERFFLFIVGGWYRFRKSETLKTKNPKTH
ncbi:hypothetical protein JCM19298_2150 [Nonlabens ulvanivorans]|nr:hypothetical protein JCM19298_2150 [Nonlabens ulvanivorans]